MVFDSISPNRDDVLLINPSANVFVVGDFDVLQKDKLTYFGRTDGPSELCDDLTQLVNYPSGISDCDSQNPVLMDLFLSSDVLQKPVLHWEILVMLLSQFTLTFNQTQKGMPCLIV